MGILIVDDDSDTRKVFEKLISDDGYDVVTAESAEQAFSHLALGSAITASALTRFDLIFLDVIMPHIDGIQSCARIREDVRYQSIPIVMTTARADIKTIDQAFKSGATDYLTKPLKGIDLLACVRSKLRLKAEFERRDSIQQEMARYVPFSF
jgi:phosphoserine phosphatase RsbU/P